MNVHTKINDGAVIELPRLQTQTVDVTVIGDSALICHAWSDKAKGMMRDKQMKKAKQGREAKDPKREFEDSLYKIGSGKYGFPAIGFKAAAVTACTSIAGVTKIEARQAFHINAEFIEIQGSKPRMREDMVRIGMGVADIRYRGEFMPWFAVLPITYNVNALSLEQILNLFNTAGFGVGVGEWRPERDGQYGRFHCGTEAEVKQLKKR